MIQAKYNTLYVCEIKFSKHTIQTDVIKEMQQKIANLDIRKGMSVRPILIHVNGVDEGMILRILCRDNRLRTNAGYTMTFRYRNFRLKLIARWAM